MDDELIGPPISGLAVAVIDGRVSIYAPHTEQALLLNETASAIWLLATGEYTADEIVQTAAAQHSAPADSIRAEVVATIQRFRTEKLLMPATDVESG